MVIIVVCFELLVECLGCMNTGVINICTDKLCHTRPNSSGPQCPAYSMWWGEMQYLGATHKDYDSEFSDNLKFDHHRVDIACCNSGWCHVSCIRLLLVLVISLTDMIKDVHILCFTPNTDVTPMLVFSLLSQVGRKN